MIYQITKIYDYFYKLNFQISVKVSLANLMALAMLGLFPALISLFLMAGGYALSEGCPFALSYCVIFWPGENDWFYSKTDLIFTGIKVSTFFEDWGLLASKFWAKAIGLRVIMLRILASWTSFREELLEFFENI